MFSATSFLFPGLMKQLWKALPTWREGDDVRPLSYQVVGSLDAVKVNKVYDRYPEGKVQSKSMCTHERKLK